MKIKLSRFEPEEQKQLMGLLRRDIKFTVDISIDPTDNQIIATSSVVDVAGYGDTYAVALLNIGLFFDGFVKDLQKR